MWISLEFNNQEKCTMIVYSFCIAMAVRASKPNIETYMQMPGVKVSNTWSFMKKVKQRS